MQRHSETNAALLLFCVTRLTLCFLRPLLRLTRQIICHESAASLIFQIKRNLWKALAAVQFGVYARPVEWEILRYV